MWVSRSYQRRIGVFTSDWRRLENAVVELNELEHLLKRFLKEPYGIDEYAICKLIVARGEAARTRAVAASGAPTILAALQKLASEKTREFNTITKRDDSALKTIRILMCRAMLESIDREIDLWQIGG